jgi:hypothetical protein
MSAFGHIPSDKLSDGFDCYEEGCEGYISPTTAEEVVLSRTDLGDPIPSVVCSKCHRAYSGISGMPLVFEHARKVFYFNNRLEFIPLNCNERAEYVEYLLGCANSAQEGSRAYRAYERRLSEIRVLPHVEGCKGNENLNLCTCGQYRADRWVSNQV